MAIVLPLFLPYHPTTPWPRPSINFHIACCNGTIHVHSSIKKNNYFLCYKHPGFNRKQQFIIYNLFLNIYILIKTTM